MSQEINLSYQKNKIASRKQVQSTGTRLQKPLRCSKGSLGSLEGSGCSGAAGGHGLRWLLLLS